ncbi:glycine cleavage system protein H [Pandoraea pneumonica]|jgi:glycine cleavage system H protein|uniref:Glycine cleavage system H protein n=1 Tax=Pandoraea pneumonica TaxID=2508299 RepID=A0A5E4UI84_9BURK|nr:glycine cleavage system protein GcvH [Pandoraea pneumonica]VVD97949.1 glycine cleavage system protein H [Pandoraea pneumonica]
MANTPDNLKYAESHEWARLEADGTVTIGITDHAQEALGDVVFIELPDTGRTVKAQEQVAVVESVKAASDIYAPIGGEIIETNSEVAGSPEQINSDPYANWLFRIKPADVKELDGLLTAEQYNAGPGA